jgi:hypothetical protein
MKQRLALSLLVLLVPQSVWAFSARGHHWANQASDPVSYRIHPDGAPGIDDGSDLEAVRKAFATWQGVSCSYLKFREDPWTDPRAVAVDGANHIYWTDQATEWPSDQRTTIALTFTFYRTSDNIIQDADIIANAVNYQWTTIDGQAGGTRVDTETIMLHEIGHFFGLDHTQDPVAVMFPSNNKLKQRDLTPDDVNGICALYGNGMPAPSSPMEGGAVGAPCQEPDNCASRLCIQDAQINRSYCTAPCSVAMPECPAGYQCTRTPEGEFCLPPIVTDELCDFCATSDQCSSGLCLNVPGYNYFQPFCTRACDPTNGVPGQCPNEYQCVPVYSQGQTGGVCAPTTGVCNPAGKGGHGEPCYSNGGCKPQHICVDYFGDGMLKFCYYECPLSADGQSCSDSAPVICSRLSAPNPDFKAACFDVSFAGQPCIPEQCGPGTICAWEDTLESAICYAFCNAGRCPANTQCQGIAGIGELCIPNMGFLPLGSGCKSDAECESRTCRVFGQEMLCTSPCTSSDMTSCPGTFRCIPQQPGVTEGFCWPLATAVSRPEDGRNIDIKQLPPGYCECDTTSQCDRDCECDVECAGGCSCRASAREQNGAGLLIALLLAGLVRARKVR